jgi:DNA-binding MarR family transcriptional regulator
MKELAQRIGCDASFVAAVADALERHGLARRAPSERGRRAKHLVLTEDGIAAKEQLMRELATKMPWCCALDDIERELPGPAQQDPRCRPLRRRERAGEGRPAQTPRSVRTKTF